MIPFDTLFVYSMAAVITAIGYRGWKERLTFSRRPNV